MSDNIQIGTAGFGYKDWLGNFYPQFCPPADFLRYYASKFSTVELDVTFYRIPSESMVKKWASSTPEHFTFAAKFPRTVTHEGDVTSRLQQAEQFVSVITKLGSRLGPLLLQFPYSFRPESCSILKAIVDSIPKDIQLAVELRHKSWLSEDLYKWLTKRGLALCLVDHANMPRLSVKTADFQYIRMIGDHKRLTEDFSYVRFDRAEDLQWWRELVNRFAGEQGRIYGYFNNHYSGHAPTTACQFLDLLKTG